MHVRPSKEHEWNPGSSIVHLACRKHRFEETSSIQGRMPGACLPSRAFRADNHDLESQLTTGSRLPMATRFYVNFAATPT